MWESLQHLAAQQTTAPELATFLLLVTIACVLLSGLIYVLIMTGAWWVRLRPQHNWRSVVFPDLMRLRQFSWEYALAGLTSIVLALTLAEKDRLVDQVLALPAQDFLDNHLLSAVFPLHRLPTAADSAGGAYRDAIAGQMEVKLGDLVRGPLQEGRSGEMRALIMDGVQTVLGPDPQRHNRFLQGLILACIALIFSYLALLSRGRILSLAAARGNVDTSYDKVTGRLVVLGVCLALLLTTPIVATDAELLADSALATARQATPSPAAERLASMTASGIAQQDKQIATGTSGDIRLEIAGISAQVGEMNRILTSHGTQLTGMEGRLGALGLLVTEVGNRVATLGTQRDADKEETRRALAGLKDDLSSLTKRLDGLADPSDRLAAQDRTLKELTGRLSGLTNLIQDNRSAVDSLRNRALLFVETEQNQQILVRPAGAGAAGKMAMLANSRLPQTRVLYWLAPGTYLIAAPEIAQQDTVTLRAGQALAVSLVRTVVQ